MTTQQTIDAAVAFAVDIADDNRHGNTMGSINKTLDQCMIILEHILESDPRTFTNQDCENAWLFDRVHEAWKLLRKYIYEEVNNNVESN